MVTKEKFTTKPPQNEQHLKKVKSLNNREPKPSFFVNTEEISGKILQVD